MSATPATSRDRSSTGARADASHVATRTMEETVGFRVELSERALANQTETEIPEVSGA